MADYFGVIRRLLLAGLVLGFLVAERGMSQDASEKDRIAGLVRDLGDDIYPIRREASRSLNALGGAGRQSLEQAASSDDAEVALRAKRLLHQLAIDELWAGSPVALPETPVPLIEAIESIGRQSGNPFLFQDGLSTYQNCMLPGNHTSGPFWPVLDALCQLSGNSVRFHFDSKRQGLVLHHDWPGNNPVAYAGALRAELTTARRTFVECIDFREQTSDVEHTFQIVVDTSWENHLRLVAYQCQPEIVEAVLPSGRTLKAIGSPTRAWNLLYPPMRQLSAVVCFEPPPRTADRLAKLVLRWPMLAVGAMTELTLSQPKPGTAYFQDDLTLHLDALHRESDGTYHVVIRIARDLVPPEPRDILLRENLIELFDDQGRAFQLQRAGGTCQRGTACKPLNFRPPAPDSEPATLRLVYPRIRDIRDVVFEFQDVPLTDPTGGH